MIYRDSDSKVEFYADLYNNSSIGSAEDITWDPHRPRLDPFRRLPPWCIEKSFGPAPPSFDPDAHVYYYFATHYEMGSKRNHEGGEVKGNTEQSDSPADSAHSFKSSKDSPSASSQTSQVQPPPLASDASSTSTKNLAPAPPSSEQIAKAAYAAVTTEGSPAGNVAGTAGPASYNSKQSANGLQAPNPTGVMPSHQLLYHALHHTNIIISLLSTYLSQDAITRDFLNSNRDAQDLPHQHYNTAYGLIAARSRLRECCGALEVSPNVDEYRKKGCFQSWQLATDKLGAIVDMVEAGYQVRVLLTSGEIATIKRMWEECMALRQGTPQHEAFQLCWDFLVNRR